MNTEQINRFDELMRDKLGSYEAEPDLELLPEIHARKNRFMRSRNLTKLIIGLAILSTGLILGYIYSIHVNGHATQKTNTPPSSTSNKAIKVSAYHAHTTKAKPAATNSDVANNNMNVTDKVVANTQSQYSLSNTKLIINQPRLVLAYASIQLAKPSSKAVNVIATTTAPNTTVIKPTHKTPEEAKPTKLVKSKMVNLANELSSSSLNGTVFADATYAGKTRVDLLLLNPTTRVFEIVQSTYTNAKGYYEFMELTAGEYVIKSAGIVSYSDTYYGNATEREFASGVRVFENDYKKLNGYDIQLANHIVRYQSASIIADTNSRWVLVLDQNNNPIASVLVNKNGDVQSQGASLPAGNYTIVNPSNGNKEGNIVINPDGSGKLATPSKGSIGEPDRGGATNPTAGSEVTLTPNPATNFVRVGLTPSTADPIEVVILNTNGAVVRRYTFGEGSMQSTIDISSLSIGTYYVVVKQNGVSSSSRLIKTDNR
jgi:hypothetical protein